MVHVNPIQHVHGAPRGVTKHHVHGRQPSRVRHTTVQRKLYNRQGIKPRACTLMTKTPDALLNGTVLPLGLTVRLGVERATQVQPGPQYLPQSRPEI